MDRSGIPGGDVAAFARLLDDAKGLLPAAPTPAHAPLPPASADLVEFETFIASARVLIEERGRLGPRASRAVPDGDVEAFARLVEAATPLLFQECIEWLEWMAPIAHRLAQTSPHDILHAARVTYLEGPYVNLIRWLLSPNTDATLAARLQQAWIRQMHWGRGYVVTKACEPQCEVSMGEGRVDLRLVLPDLDVVVEAKTGTGEHMVGTSEEPQMAHYLAHAGQGGRRVGGILIGPTHIPPQRSDERVASTTFALFGRLLVIESEATAPGLEAVVLQIARHFLHRAVPRRCPTDALLPQIPALLAAAVANRATLTQHIDAIEACIHALPGDPT